MIKVQSTVREIISRDHEAHLCLLKNTLNLSSYARIIKTKVEEFTKKQVKITTIIMALSRIREELSENSPLIQEIIIDGVTLKTPLIQFVYEKTSESLEKFLLLSKKIDLRVDEWFISTQNTKYIIFLCSSSKKELVLKYMGDNCVFFVENLAAAGLSLSTEYHEQANVVFSILARFAEKRVPLSEIISTWSEVLIVFDQKYLGIIMTILGR